MFICIMAFEAVTSLKNTKVIMLCSALPSTGIRSAQAWRWSAYRRESRIGRKFSQPATESRQWEIVSVRGFLSRGQYSCWSSISINWHETRHAIKAKSLTRLFCSVVVKLEEAISWLPFPSVSKRVQVRNQSYTKMSSTYKFILM